MYWFGCMVSFYLYFIYLERFFTFHFQCLNVLKNFVEHIRFSRFYTIPGQEQNGKFHPPFCWSSSQWSVIRSAKTDYRNTQPEDISWPMLVNHTGPNEAWITDQGGLLWAEPELSGQSRPLPKVVLANLPQGNCCPSPWSSWWNSRAIHRTGFHSDINLLRLVSGASCQGWKNSYLCINIDTTE